MIYHEGVQDGIDVTIRLLQNALRYIDDNLHKAEKKVIEFANIHIEMQTKYKAAGERTLLTLSTSSTLFAANVCYHECCYGSFRSPSTKEAKDSEVNVVRELVNIMST